MRVFIATPLYPPEPGGPATYTALIEDALKARGDEVAVIPFSVVREKSKFMRHSAYFNSVFEASRNADVVFALDALSVGLPAVLAARLRGIPFMLRLGGLGSWERATERRLPVGAPHEFRSQLHEMPPKIRMLAAIERWVLRQATVVVAQGTYQKEVLKAWGVDASRIHVIYNGMNALPDMPPKHSGSREIISAGRLVELKRFDILIGAIALLKNRVLGISLSIYGSGPSQQRIQEIVSRDSLEDVISLHPELSRNELLQKISSASVFALASTHETFSNLIVEAMAVRTPVVATAVGGTPEIITNGKNGLLVPPGDSNALAEAIERLVNDQPYADELANHAAQSLNRFSEEAVIEGTVAALERAVQ